MTAAHHAGTAGPGPGPEPSAAARPGMAVHASDGAFIGTVDHVTDESIELNRGDAPDGRRHRVPRAWVARVDDRVHLNQDQVEVEAGWQAG